MAQKSHPVEWRVGLSDDLYARIIEEEQRHYLTVDELAVVLGTTHAVITNAIRRQHLPYRWIGRSRVLLRSTVAPHIQTREQVSA